MDKVFVECCGSFSSAFYNWNESYQLAWEMDDSSIDMARKRQLELYRIERAFEEEAIQCVTRLVSMEKNAPRQVPKQLVCFRDKNLFFRLLPDSRTGRHYVASLRGILQSRSSILTVPLSSFFMFKGTPVLVQALVPLPKEPVKLYGEGVAPSNDEVAAELEFIADALNTPLPDYVIAEVYEGLDGRQYVTETNITNIALDDASLLYGPIKRAEMLAVCPCVTASCEDVLGVVQGAPVLQALRGVADAQPSEQQKILSDTLHFYGINMCLLKGVFEAYRSFNGNQGSHWSQFKNVVAVEMIARTIKQEFYLEAQAKRLGMDDIGISKAFALHLRDGLNTSAKVDKFMPLLMRKFAIANGNNEDEELLDAIQDARSDSRSLIAERLSMLVGARAALPNEGQEDGASANYSLGSLSTLNKKTVFWVPLIAGRITPRLSDPKMILATAPVYESLQTNYGHTLTWVQATLARVAVWQGRYEEALQIARQAEQMLERTYGPSSARCLCNQRLLCRLLFSVPSIDNIREGCSALVPMLQGLEHRASVVTRVKVHLEVGCWLLGAARTVPNLVEEALRHFQTAEKLLPISLRSSYGSWLYIQPSLGMLRCRQTPFGRHHALPAPIQSLMSDAVYLSKIVAPADYFVEYLWELGMELAVGQHCEEAANIMTLAAKMSKNVAGSQLDRNALLSDTYKIYRAWDPEKYNSYCNTLEILQHT